MNTQPYPFPVQLLQLEPLRREAPVEWLQERETRVRTSRRRGFLRRRTGA